MRDDGKSVGTDWRNFLRLAGLGVAAGGAAVVGGPGEAKAAETSETSDGYRETEHVKTYYKLARF